MTHTGRLRHEKFAKLTDTMLRVLPLLAFALVPAGLAAPVPPGGRVEFGIGGLLTRDDLDKVKFDSRPATEKDRIGVTRDRRIPAGKAPEKAAVAVHMPWSSFREGEPVPAYFVFKNGSDRDVPIEGRLDLFGPRAGTWDSCAIGVFNARTGERVPILDRSGSSNGSELMIVPANGFYCARYNIGHTDAGTPLPPGEYEVEWQCAGLYSATVRFTVTRRDDGVKLTARPKLNNVHFYPLTPERNGERRPTKAGEPFIWDACRIDRLFAGDVFAALAVGHGGVFATDLYAIPDSDKLVQASVVWKPYRDGERVAVTLTARDPKKPVRFAQRPQLYFHFRATEMGDLPDPLDALPPSEKTQPGEALVTPLTIEVRLPDRWLERTGVHSSARVAVLVTSGVLELPGARGKSPKPDAVRPSNDPVWEGVLLTPFTTPRFSPGLHTDLKW